jgi:hypothetical protein
MAKISRGHGSEGRKAMSEKPKPEALATLCLEQATRPGRKPGLSLGQLKADYQDIINRDRKHAEAILQIARETEKFIGPVVDECATNIRNVQMRITEGDESVISESADYRKEATGALGVVLTGRAGAFWDLSRFKKRKSRWRRTP